MLTITQLFLKDKNKMIKPLKKKSQDNKKYPHLTHVSSVETLMRMYNSILSC